MRVEEFTERLVASSVEEVVQEVILADTALHVPEDDRNYIKQRLGESYGVEATTIEIWIVGSAKLGFSITEKRRGDAPVLPRFRPFRAESDIDVAVVCPAIFDAIWAELSAYAYRSVSSSLLPWNSGNLGHYLVHGWLRPDHFPRARLPRCDMWWDLFYSLSREARFNRHRVRGALFHSVQDLTGYQTRAVTDCRLALELAK